MLLQPLTRKPRGPDGWIDTARQVGGGFREGSSLYRLPKVLQWFTGNIGFHHIHHLSPRIPNYYLEKCQRENPLSQRVRQITLLSSLKSLTFRLWDEEHRMLVGYKVLRNYRRSRAYEQ